MNALKLLKRQDRIAARSQLEQILIEAPKFSKARLTLSEIYLEEGKVRDAIQLLKVGLKLQPKISAYWMRLGIAYEKLNQSDEAIAAYQNALQTGKLSPTLKERIHQRLQILENLKH